MASTSQTVEKRLQLGESVILAAVLETQASTPRGMKIGSETPEEIGQSIVAELIQVRDQSIVR